MKYTSVKFLSSKDYPSGTEYTFKNSLGIKLKKYDAVIVDTVYGLAVATVENPDADIRKLSIRGMDSCTITREILEKIDSKAIKEHTKPMRIKSLKKEIEQTIKKMDQTKVYEQYAAQSPELAAMLEQLKELE